MVHYLVTCEHASDSVPHEYAECMRSRDAQAALLTHRGIDFGALDVANALCATLHAPLFQGQMTRLLIDLNRTSSHPRLFSKWSRRLSTSKMDELKAHHLMHYQNIKKTVEEMAKTGPVRHIGVHSFTPVYRGKERPTDIGLLYDPRREREVSWITALRSQLLASSSWKVHRNLPYRGTSDGLTTWLRGHLPDSHYCGIELEINQKWLLSAQKAKICTDLVQACVQLDSVKA